MKPARVLDLAMGRTELVSCGDATHLADVAYLRRKGIAVAHWHSGRAIFDSTSLWKWCRILSQAGRLESGFSIRLSPSRLFPGALVGRIERLGRRLHAELEDLDRVISEVANSIPGLRRLDVQVYDEATTAREAYVATVMAAGGRYKRSPLLYEHTLCMSLCGSNDELIGTLSGRSRRSIRRFLSQPNLRVGVVADVSYGGRLAEIHSDTFRRTGAVAPQVNFVDVIRDSTLSGESVLLGVFDRERKNPDDLVASIWGSLNGDYAIYELGASDRSGTAGNMPVGYPLMLELAEWARQRGANWLDLGGVPARDDSNAESLGGIVQFKRAFSQNECLVANELAVYPASMLGRVSRAWDRYIARC